MSKRDSGQTGFIMRMALVGAIIIAAILIIGAWWVGQSAKKATDDAVRSISMFYLDELTGRREQVVEANLGNNIENMRTAVALMSEDDLSDVEHLQAYQNRVRSFYNLEMFAFVDENGLIYTADGTQENIEDYDFDYRTISEPEISVRNLHTSDKKVVIAMPVDLPFMDGRLVVCFIEIDVEQMIDGLSLQTDSDEATFCNIYTSDGVALTDMVLGGLASEDNLLDALEIAEFEDGYSLEQITEDFETGSPGLASFEYNGIQETLDYVPIPGTDWMLTYLVRESVITEQVSGVMDGITARSIAQTAITALVLFAFFVVAFIFNRRNARLMLEREKEEAANRAKQKEMEHRLELQEKLLEEERQRARQGQMITALASDYRSVYYISLDDDEGICYQSDRGVDGSISAGEKFCFSEVFSEYAHEYVDKQYLDGFLEFIEPASIKEALSNQLVSSYRYLVHRDGVESYEMLRMAGVRHAADRDDGIVHAVGVAFADVDRETRDSMERNQALSDALAVAEDANKAKTAFLSSMSHEIRTPMNAIIGLDSIALADKDVPEQTRGHLEKIGDSARHLLDIINDILDVSRIESGRMTINNETFSFSKLLEQVNTIIGGQCDDKGLTYHCEIAGQVDDNYVGDAMKLRQVLINILGNAVKFTPEGGSVTHVIERTAHYEGRSTLRFVMSDTGIGMDENFLPHVFDAFAQEDSSSTNRYGSTGLGLAITKSLVEMMNGTIDVKSVKGKGSTFTVTVTLADVEGSEGGYADMEISPQDLSVLVIDDDPVACEHAKLVLEEIGIAAQVALSGAEAVEMTKLRHARRDPFNLILVDWRMPEMDGIETTRQLRAIAGDESAIIILTAYNWDDIVNEALEAGVDSFIAKPLFAASVLDEFKKAFERKGAAILEPRRADLAGRRVLLAEDVQINAEIMMQMLSMKQMEVDHAINGKVAVEKFAASEPGHYDAILMDMRMPEMDGLTATSTIRAMDRSDAKTVPIIALTANAFDEDVQKSLQAGLNAHLSKPVEPESVFETLESLIAD